MGLSDKARGQLRKVSTATLTTVLFKRGLRNAYIQGVGPLNPDAPQLVGEAYTLRYIPAREDIDVIDVFKDPSHPQRMAVEAIPPGQVLVMDCRGDASVASAGGILVTRMMIRGAAGVVSDGGLRDLHGNRATALPGLLRRPIGADQSHQASRRRYQRADRLRRRSGFSRRCPCRRRRRRGGHPGGDRREVAQEAADQDVFETFVIEKVKAGSSIVGLYPPNEATQKEYADWRAKRPKS